MSETQTAPANGAATNGSVQFRDPPAEGVNSADRNALLRAASEAMRASEAKSEAAAAAAKAAAPESEPPAAAEEPTTPAETETPAAEDPPASGGELADDKSEAPPAAPPEKVDAAANLRRLLKLKEHEQTERERIESDSRQLREQAQAEAKKIIDDAKNEAQRYVRGLLDGFRGRPLEAAREVGFDVDTLLAQKADEQDPNAQMKRWLEGELSGIKKALTEQTERSKALEERNEEWQRIAQETSQNHAQERFLSQAQDDTYEFARELWSPPELIAKAKGIIKNVQEAAKRQGVHYSPSNVEVLTFLNEEAQEHLKAKAPSWAKLLQKVGATAVVEAPKSEEKPVAKPGLQKTQANGKAPAGQGQGPRTLSAQAQSERRAPPKPLDKDLSDREFRELAVASAKEILGSKT